MEQFTAALDFFHVPPATSHHCPPTPVVSFADHYWENVIQLQWGGSQYESTLLPLTLVESMLKQISSNSTQDWGYILPYAPSSLQPPCTTWCFDHEGLPTFRISWVWGHSELLWDRESEEDLSSLITLLAVCRMQLIEDFVEPKQSVHPQKRLAVVFLHNLLL